MELLIDVTKEYALCLEGGGAKGAYQIGAWRALKEAGVRISAVAGTSVGALNGALICMGDLETAEDIWRNISQSQVMEVAEETVTQFLEGNAKWNDWMETLLKCASEGGADITPLKELISDCIDEKKIRAGKIAFYLHTFSLSEMKELDVNVKEIEEGQLQDYLLASAYLPVFKRKKLHGKKYMDPGILNNVPIDSLIKRDYKDIIVLRIFGPGRCKPVEIPTEVKVYSVEPRVSLGNFLNFEGKKSSRNLKIGYYDTKRMLYGLSGKIYYIDEKEDEDYYFKKFVGTKKQVMEYLNRVYLDKQTKSTCRNYMEDTLDAIAEELRMKKYDYKELYLSIVEATAKLFRIQKYCIYTLEELITEIVNKKTKITYPAFVSIILNRVPIEYTTEGNIKQLQ